MTHPNRRTLSLPEVLVTVTLLGMLLLVFLGPVVMRTKNCGAGKCSSNLRQMALGAISYASDKRFFPHVRSMKALDGSWKTNDSLRVYAALIHFGYLDSPEVFVCPSSFDLYVPMDGPQLEDKRVWTFGPAGSRNPDPACSPLSPGSDAGISDTLLLSDQVSYGWTRRPMNNNTPSSRLLGADRALEVPGGKPPTGAPGTFGNHSDGWNVVRADCSTTFLKLRDDRGDGLEPFDYLGATSAATDGNLAMEWIGANPERKQP